MGAFGTFDFENIRSIPLGSGIATDFGVLLPPGGRVAAYVRSTGVQNFDDEDVKRRIFTTLNAALAQCRSGAGDIVYVLPGHAENIASANQLTNLVAGTKIIGLGDGTLRPTFTWTTATSTVLMNVAGVVITNCILKLEPGAGTVTVAAPITISAAGCTISNCRIMFGTDASNLVTIGITTTAAADDFTFEANECYGATAAECTTFMQLVGADRAKILNNRIIGATSATGVGLIRFLTTASLDVRINNLFIRNNKAASTAAITGMAGLTGEVDNLFMAVLSDNAAALVLSTGAFGTAASLVFGVNVAVTNTIAERAAGVTPLSA